MESDRKGAAPPVQSIEPAFPWWLLLLTAIGCSLFFIGVGGGYWPAWAREAWNLGHLPVFAGLAWIGWRWLPGKTSLMRWLVGLGLALLLGIAVELLQVAVGGRDVSLGDVLLDLCGTWVGLWWVNHRRLWRHSRPLALLMALVTVCVLSLASVPLLRAAASAVVGHWFFPILLHPEMPALDERMDTTGGGTLRWRREGIDLQFGPGSYSGFKLYDMPSDWRDYRQLRLSLQLDGSEPLTVVCRVHDVRHDQRMTDRFNRRYVLSPGPIELAIDLADVAAAPHGRRMTMDDVLELGCFTASGQQGRRLLLREVRLR